MVRFQLITIEDVISTALSYRIGAQSDGLDLGAVVVLYVGNFAGHLDRSTVVR